jgi:hypothetical protein
LNRILPLVVDVCRVARVIYTHDTLLLVYLSTLHEVPREFNMQYNKLTLPNPLQHSSPKSISLLTASTQERPSCQEGGAKEGHPCPCRQEGKRLLPRCSHWQRCDVDCRCSLRAVVPSLDDRRLNDTLLRCLHSLTHHHPIPPFIILSLFPTHKQEAPKKK